MKILSTGIKKGRKIKPKQHNQNLDPVSETKEILWLTKVTNYCIFCICLQFFYFPY